MKIPAVALTALALSLLVAASALAAPKPPRAKPRTAPRKAVVTTTTTPRTEPAPTTTTRTEPAPPTTTTRAEPPRTEPALTTTVRTEPAPTLPQLVDARGKISSLRGDGLTVTRENGTSLSCRYAPGQAASIAAASPLGTAVKITCTPEGTGYRLATIERV